MGAKLKRFRTDILVLGGGPAGGAAALELAQAGCEVVLLERQATSGWKIGETLPPEARSHLQRLKHWETFQQSDHIANYGIVSSWGSSVPVEVDFMMNPYGHGWNLNRSRFENDLLQSASDEGCQVLLGTEASALQYHSNQWHIATSTSEIVTQWLLDCTGRKGILAQQGLAGTFETLQDYVSLYCVLDSAEREDRDSRTYVESHPTGWAYSALMPSGSRIVAFLTDRDLIPAGIAPAQWMRQCIQEGSLIKQLLKKHDYKPFEKVHLISAESGHYHHFAGPHWMLVGDAAMTFDPLSGLGSAKALVSAAAAVQLVINGIDYQATCEELWRNYLVQYRDYYLAERRWSDAPFWSRRHQTVLT